ncbi:MAG: M14 family zinc carboxypeptidase [Candidatus Krumholzibacteria bacterium]|nr:M14 family zinc carboxypeptidase [Candidatus Krumholzibacteria bacterium]
MNALLDSLALANPSLARVDTLGTSLLGRPIRAIRISDNVAADEGEPEILIMGAHHSREIMSVEVPLLFAKYLLERYGTDAAVTGLVDTRAVWIVPMMNVDGHVYVEQNHDGSSAIWWNKNRRPNGDGSYGVDLNRNYSYNWGYDDEGSSPETWSGQYRGTGPFSERETRAVRDLCARRHFVLSLSYHSYGEQILFPWGYAALDTPDNDLFFAIGDSLRQGNGYAVGNAASGEIYLTNGDSDDWLYGDTQAKNRIFGFTIELNSYDEGGYSPPDSLIQPTFEKMLGMNMAALRVAGDPRFHEGPWPPTMNPVTSSDPPAYEISWSGPDPQDPHPSISYELTEIKNLAGTVDSIEAPGALWATGGFALTNARAYAGSYSFCSGSGDNLLNTLSMANIYPLWLPQTLSCRLWYDIELDWDYAYLEGSLDDGDTWVTLPGDLTTNLDPNGANRGNGITGASGGWVSATFDLSSLMAGGSGFILLRFLYVTDGSVNGEGLYVDLVNPVTRCARSSVIASSLGSTSFRCWPDEIGNFIYYVRAFDAMANASERSDLAVWQVDAISDSTPHPFASGLEQNYPNPFNPATTIGYYLSRHAHVTLEVYDARGRLVASLANGQGQASGYHAMEWDGRDASGNAAASGVYFYRLRAGTLVQSRKMILMR